MAGIELQTGLLLLVAAVAGVAIGWLLRARNATRRLEQVGDDWQPRFDKAVRQYEHLKAENTTLSTSLEAGRTALLKHEHAAARSRTEIESLRERAKTQAKDIFMLGSERDGLSAQLSTNQKTLDVAKLRISELQMEIQKSKDYYKTQLEAATDQRKVLERKIEDAQMEHDSLNNLLAAARAEHVSVSNMLASAHARLDSLESLEDKVVALEADNAELRHEAAVATREAEALKRDVAELDALKVQNKELAHCLESMENSRKQYEEDALRYRTQYEQAEKQSDTLRVKLGDIEKNFVETQQAQEESRNSGNGADDAIPPFGLAEPDGEPDDLTEIVGIGRVFEETLHSLGIFHFRQIAAFGPVEVARVNAELKEFRGRIEQDDWIGQAKELHFRKYGEADE